jgi:CTD kinase subunit beta
MTATMAPAAVAVTTEQPGPHPSYIQVAKPFIFEQKIQGQIIATGANPQREDTFRLQGVQWIDDTRRALQLSVPPTALSFPVIRMLY